MTNSALRLLKHIPYPTKQTSSEHGQQWRPNLPTRGALDYALACLERRTAVRPRGAQRPSLSCLETYLSMKSCITTLRIRDTIEMHAVVEKSHLIFPRYRNGRRRSRARQVKLLVFPRVRHVSLPPAARLKVYSSRSSTHAPR